MLLNMRALQVIDSVALWDNPKQSPVLGAYTQFGLSYSSTPFVLTLTGASAKLDVTLFTDITITVDQAFPITATSAIRFSGDLSNGTSNLRRLGITDQHGKTLEVARRLDGSATCSSGEISFVATNAGFIGATIGPILANTLVEGIAGASGFSLPPALSAALPSTVIIKETAVVQLSSNGPVQDLIDVCLTSGVTMSGTSGGSSSSTSHASTTCGGGCGAGIFCE